MKTETCFPVVGTKEVKAPRKTSTEKQALDCLFKAEPSFYFGKRSPLSHLNLPIWTLIYHHLKVFIKYYFRTLFGFVSDYEAC